jgi:hypothetical protein
MTSPRFLSPKAMHAPISHHLYVNKSPYVDPNTPSPNSSTARKAHPLTRDLDERRRAQESIPKRT